MSASAFSSSDAVALEREVELSNELIKLEEIWNEHHKQETLAWIRLNNYQRICLQFPDDYLHCSTQISVDLDSQLTSECKVFIMADTSYGSCCVDEIAAEHVQADSIIHFGNACRSKVGRLPVLYMFPEFEFNMANFIEQLKETLTNKCSDKSVCLYLDVGYHYLLKNDDSKNSNEQNFIVSVKEALPCQELLVEEFPPVEHTKLDPKDAICIFLGADNNNFFQLSLTTKAGIWYIYDVNKNCLKEKNPLTTNYIRRRYYYIEKCKDAAVLGLIVATLSAEGYLDVVARLQQMAKARGIKTQIISVGRINPAKLANFLEIDCFILIGCPFNNMYNSKDYYKPIISVFEAEMALNPAWQAQYPEHYVSDFKQLLPEGRSFLAFNADNLKEYDVSLISGSLRCAATTNDTELADITALSENQRAVMAPGKMALMTSNTGLTFEDRTWRGLEQALGETEPAKLQKGLSGIPIKYTHD